METIDKEMNESLVEEESNDTSAYIKMDFTIEDPAARVKKVEEIIANTPPEKLTSTYLKRLADYIVLAMDKQERAQKHIITDNRAVTLNRRETSFEGLVGKLENGEDGIYNMITNDKNVIFRPKAEITDQDIAEIPALRALRDEIERVEELSKGARGKRAYALKKMLIEMRQDQYVIRNSYKKPFRLINLTRSASKMDLGEHIAVDAESGKVTSDGLFNFFDERNISAILCNYSKLVEDSWEDLHNDLKWLMADFDNLVDATLKDRFPLYYDLLIYKIDGRQNAEIQELLYQTYGVKHSVEYISSLWRKKIPKLIAEEATNEWLVWHYTYEERGRWKRCSRCGQIKLAHNNFFSRNRTSKDGWYSICKECRNKKSKEVN